MSTTQKAEGEIDIIQGEVCQIEEAMHQLPEKRATLLRRLNDKQASTRVLPSEILSLIFGHVQGTRGTYPVLIISHVSSHWRQVARSTPQLWTSMFISLSGGNAHGIPHILDLHFRNVSSLPFSLELGLSFTTPSPIVADAILAIETLLFDDENARKVTSLQLFHWQLSNIPSNFSRLEHFAVCYWFRGCDLFLSNLPRLRRVNLSNMHGNVLLPWSSITELYLCSIPINVCVKLLTHCPNLLDFHSFDPDDDLNEMAESHILVSPITLHPLRSLGWSYSNSPCCLAAVQHIRLPALRALSWSQAYETIDEVEPVVRALFSNLPSGLQSLRLVSVNGWTLPMIRHIFHQSRHVQTLSLAACDKKSAYGVLCALCPGWEGDGTRYLPALKSLTIHRCHVLDDGYSETPIKVLDHDFSHRVLEVCKAKFIGSGNQLKLLFEELEVDWAPGVLEELGAMVRDGFQLEVRDVGGNVEW